MNKPIDIHKAGAVLLDGDGNFLVARNKGKDFFIAPGGKIEAGETVVQALARELREELQITIDIRTVEKLGTYIAAAAGQEEKILQMDVYIVHDSDGEPIASSEVEEIRWINTQTQDITLGSIFEHDVMPTLKARGLID